MYVCGGWKDGWTDRWMKNGGEIERWMVDGWTDGWMVRDGGLWVCFKDEGGRAWGEGELGFLHLLRYSLPIASAQASAGCGSGSV